MKYKWKLLLIIPVAAVVVFGLLKAGGNLAGGKDADKDTVNNAVQTVVVKEVTRAKMENVMSLTGTLEALHEASVSSKVAGRVSRVAVENGHRVSPGQSLVFLEYTEYRNALSSNQALLQKANAALLTARSNHDRFSELHKQGAVSDKDFEDISTALALAEADVSSAEAAVSNAEENLRNATINAPLGGVVADRNVNVGQVVSPGMQLMTISDISSVYAVVNIEQAKIAQIKPGLKAVITLDAYPGKTFEGVVDIINPVASKSARVFETKIKINNRDGLLKPGMFAKADIKIGGAEEVAAVSRDALTDREGLYFVFMARDGKAVRQQVQIGKMIDQLVEIKSGLAPGQKVIVTNVNKLKDQDSIKIAE
ncbi:Co/Zn/Cd efflux system membrane fusion protein [Desulfocucumis palustris]|uniref:Co/Zn/Cd efflux system membrane fusion protein n=1 Tax=Desulfocucumis palustris TaxID=1898651 RepID=A0A2L2XGJ0_9FIRM|nr:efflux RND transporter periplasmic adaptor subunit [Desulfocucumis palustris]GBF35250.1 Co/Zn/Cd efflux system membrane fusion protein [Desulfocucumis palustris]